MTEKVKKYEISVYSYKNQIRNLKRSQLHGGDVNIQLINVFINAICDIVQHICSDVRTPVLALLPLIHSILNSITVRDKKIYRCTKLIHTVLTQIGDTHVKKGTGERAQEEVETKDELPPHKLEDLEWIASETDDKGWLAITDRWELCKRDLKWLCVKTNNRSWLLYRHLWEHCSNDLKYVSVLFDDKKWLHLHNVWKFIPLSLKLRAISLKDPTVCKPSLTEMILKDDDIYRDNTLPLSSHLLSKPNVWSDLHLAGDLLPKCFPHSRMGIYSHRNNTHLYASDPQRGKENKKLLLLRTEVEEGENFLKEPFRNGMPGMEKGTHEGGVYKSEKMLGSSPVNRIKKDSNFVGRMLYSANSGRGRVTPGPRPAPTSPSKGEGWKRSPTGRNISRTLTPQNRHEGEGDNVAVPCAEKEANRDGSLGRSKYCNETHVKEISNRKEVQADVYKRGLTQKVTPKDAKQHGMHTVESYKEELAKRQGSKDIMRGKKFLLKVPNRGSAMGNQEKQSCHFKGTEMSAKSAEAVGQRSGLSVEPHILKEGSNPTGVEGTDKSNTLGETTVRSLKADIARRLLPPPQKGKIVPKGKGPQLGEYTPILKHPLSEKGSEVEQKGSTSLSVQNGKVKMPNGQLEGVTSKVKNGPKKMPPLTGGLKSLLKIKEPNGKNISDLLKRKSFKESPLDLKKSGSIVHLDEVVIPTSSEDGGREEEIQASVSSQREESPKKAPKGNSSTYFSDLFNAFNFTINGKLGRPSSHSADTEKEERSSEFDTPGEEKSSEPSDDSGAEQGQHRDQIASDLEGKAFPGVGEEEGEMVRRRDSDKGSSDGRADGSADGNTDGNVDGSTKWSAHPMGRSLKGYSMKRDFLQVKKSVSNAVEPRDVGIRFQGDPLTKTIGHLDQKNAKGFPPILEKPMQKFPPRKSSGILQKVLNADLAHLNYSNKRMTAEEIAKHKNASLHITVKRKVSLSSLKMKAVPKR